jgi:hypothetical protein
MTVLLDTSDVPPEGDLVANWWVGDHPDELELINVIINLLVIINAQRPLEDVKNGKTNLHRLLHARL